MVGVTKVELRKMLKELLRPGDPSLKDNKDWSGKQYAVNVCKMLSCLMRISLSKTLN